jgi:hypothetical protein
LRREPHFFFDIFGGEIFQLTCCLGKPHHSELRMSQSGIAENSRYVKEHPREIWLTPTDSGSEMILGDLRFRLRRVWNS